MTDLDLALARAVLARAIKLGLRRPDSDTLEAFNSDPSRRTLREAAAALEAEPEGPLCGAVERMLDLSLVAPDALDARHAALFGHSLRGRVCPYETEYGSGAPFQQSQELADISGFYLAFGMEPSASVDSERLDHAACELEYLEFLFVKEAYAIETDDAEMREVTCKAARDFIRLHLGRFGVAFGSALRQEDHEGFHGAIGNLCAEFLRYECGRLGLQAGPEFLELRSTEDDGVPMACGDGPCGAAEASESDLVQIRSQGGAG